MTWGAAGLALLCAAVADAGSFPPIPKASTAVLLARGHSLEGDHAAAVNLLVAPAERGEAYAAYELGKALHELGLRPLALHYYLLTMTLDPDGAFDQYVIPKAVAVGRDLGDYRLLPFLWDGSAGELFYFYGPARWAFQRGRCEISMDEVPPSWVVASASPPPLVREEERLLKGNAQIDVSTEVLEVLWQRHVQVTHSLFGRPRPDPGAHCPHTVEWTTPRGGSEPPPGEPAPGADPLVDPGQPTHP